MQYRVSGRERGAENKAWKLFQAVGDVEVVEHAAVGIDVGGSVRGHEEGRDLDDARRIGGWNSFHGVRLPVWMSTRSTTPGRATKL